DGEIAVAAGDTVQLLVTNHSQNPQSIQFTVKHTDSGQLPNVTSPTGTNPFTPCWTAVAADQGGGGLGGGGGTTTSALWTRVALPPALFTAAERPQALPLGASSFSLGEETGGALAVAARWSPPGLAAHGRCALAVLTSNLALSLWAPVAAPAR